MLLQATHWWKCMLPTGLKPRERGLYVQYSLWIGWRHRNRQIWRYFWQNMPPAKKVTWSYIIDRISWFIRGPGTCAQHPRVRLKISCSLWSPRHTVLLSWMGVTKMQAIKSMIKPCPCCKNIFGGQEWPAICRSQRSPAHIACSMRTGCQGTPTPNCVHHSYGSLTCRLYKYRDNHGAKQTTQGCKCPGVPEPFYKVHYGICDPQPDCKNSCQVFVSGLHLNLWGPRQALCDCSVNFMSTIISEMCKLLGMKKLCTPLTTPKQMGW